MFQNVWGEMKIFATPDLILWLYNKMWGRAQEEMAEMEMDQLFELMLNNPRARVMDFWWNYFVAARKQIGADDDRARLVILFLPETMAEVAER